MGAEGLAGLPAGRQKAREAYRPPDVQLEQIQQVLRMDAAFTADVLRLANSPLIGMRGEIKSVMQAVMMLGLERIKALPRHCPCGRFLPRRFPAALCSPPGGTTWQRQSCASAWPEFS